MKTHLFHKWYPIILSAVCGRGVGEPYRNTKAGTISPNKVTCQNCKKTKAYRDAVGKGMK